MTQWWSELTLLSQIFVCMAVPASLILVIQTITVLIGMGGNHGDVDSADAGELDMDVDDTHDFSHAVDGLRVFTVRGLVAFFTIGGWVGFSLAEAGVAPVFAILLSLLSGVAAMVLVALLFKWMLSLQDHGNISLSNAIGLPAQVYLTIPAARKGTGKITLTLQERYIELDAMTDSEKPLTTGRMVTVKGLIDSSLLLVGE